MDAIKAIRELDKILGKKGLSYVLYTCGGAQLIFLGHSTRRTEDVDLIIKELDGELKLAALQVAQKLDLEKSWLNNQVFDLGKRLGRGWKKKAVLLYQGKAISLMGLDRQSLINAKLHAAIDRRGEDYADLMFLKPDLVEIRLAEAYVLKQKLDLEIAEVFVRAWVRELIDDLDLN